MSYPPQGGYPSHPGGYGYHPPPLQSRSSGIGFEDLVQPPQQSYQAGFPGSTMAMPAPSPGYSTHHAPGYGTPPSYGMPAPQPTMSFGGVASTANAATVFRGSHAMPVPEALHMDYNYAAQGASPVYQSSPSASPYSHITPQVAPSYQAPPPSAPIHPHPSSFASTPPSVPPSAPPLTPPSVPPSAPLSTPPSAPSHIDGSGTSGQIQAVSAHSSQSVPTPPNSPPLQHTPPSHSPLPRHSSSSSSLERMGSEKKSRTQGTVQDFSPFYPEKDAETLRKAMKGLGCDSKAVLHIISTKSNCQRQQISHHFNSLYDRDLMKDLKSELGGHFEDVILSLMRTPPVCDAHNLRRAMKGLGTDEDTLIEILCSRTNSEIRAFTKAFSDEYDRNLEKDIISETNGHFKKFLVALLKAQREEHKQVDMSQAYQDAVNLYKAGEGRWGTDEATFNHIFSTRNFDQLIATFESYKQTYKCDIEESITKEMTGDLKDSLIAIVRCARNTPAYFAERLHRSLKGKNDDSTIIRIIVSRSEIDMVQIKEEFLNKYGQTLAKWIVDNTKGKYKNALLQLIGERTL